MVQITWNKKHFTPANIIKHLIEKNIIFSKKDEETGEEYFMMELEEVIKLENLSNKIECKN